MEGSTLPGATGRPARKDQTHSGLSSCLPLLGTLVIDLSRRLEVEKHCDLA